MSVKVFCIVLNFNQKKDTINCINSLIASDLPKGTEILIVDNGPANLRKYFLHSLPEVHYLKSADNIGFAAGNNLGIEFALSHNATHILLVNPDVQVPKVFLQPLLATLTESGSRGIVAPVLTEGKGIYDLGGRVHWPTATFEIESVKFLPTSPSKYEFLTFACVLVRAQVFREAGLLDSKYFMYLEDVDYCLAAAQAGYELWLDPTVIARHDTSSSYPDPRKKILFSFRSIFTFITKWISFPQNIIPYIHALYFYPKEYLVWSLRIWKRAILRRYAA